MKKAKCCPCLEHVETFYSKNKNVKPINVGLFCHILQSINNIFENTFFLNQDIILRQSPNCPTFDGHLLIINFQHLCFIKAQMTQLTDEF